ncbi:SET domain-containing protein [Clathrospora elynae]|uniref:SET domain-containing protein n=1 Tax=Clathrospora elynae TaxID=706981 RepID=A0A6A5SPW2_9PLEO|nr:SET domain-containing protein [Clathrospora elynae]
MMFTQLRYISLLIAQFTLVTSTEILDRQCWHEYPFRTIELRSSLDGTQDYATSIQIFASHDVKDNKEKEHTPWTHPPICTEKLPSINDKLCIYTSTTFSSGRGISLFTTPALAAQFAALPAFQDPSALSSQSVNTQKNTYSISPIPGKGLGMLASKPLRFGDRVMAHTPAFIAYLESELSTAEREAWWRQAVEALPEEIKEKFLGLSFVYGDERVRVQDIVKANTFAVEIGGVSHLAVFPETSRVNHACGPNAQYIIDTEILTHYIHVTRPIAQGEEITISYTSPLYPTEIRNKHLEQGFHFTCTCPRCTSPSSSQTLDQIESFQNHLNDWSDTSPASPQMAENLLHLHRTEGLEGFMDISYGFAALAYNAVGDAEAAKQYAEKAREAVLMKDGAWADNLRIWEEMLGEGVEGHWSWRRRV